MEDVSCRQQLASLARWLSQHSPGMGGPLRPPDETWLEPGWAERDMIYTPFDPGMLPDASGIYMIFHGTDCLSVGQSVNMHQRWHGHHILPALHGLSADLTMAWRLAPEEALHALEARLIMQLRPRLNRVGIGHLSRPRTMVECPICGSAFPIQRSTGRYCGDACRQRSYRARKRREPKIA
jgi:hypothetical protein